MQIIDAWFEAIAWVLIQIHAGLGHVFDPNSGAAWGLSIVLLTCAVRLLIFPLYVKQIRSSHKMQELQPKIKELRKKYKNDKQRLNQETVKLYQEHGANPLSGCLPLVIQAPFFFGLYRVLRAISEPSKYHISNVTDAVTHSAQQAHIFGVPISASFRAHAGELHGADPTTVRIVIGCFVVVSACTTFMTIRQSTRRAMSMPGASESPMAKQQKYMAYISPLFALYGFILPMGVLIYWVTTNIWTLGQQHLIYGKMMRATEDTDPAATDGKPAKRSKSGSLAGGTPSGSAASSAGNGHAEPKIVRNQPSRQSRSKRTGNKKR